MRERIASLEPRRTWRGLRLVDHPERLLDHRSRQDLGSGRHRRDHPAQRSTRLLGLRVPRRPLSSSLRVEPWPHRREPGRRLARAFFVDRGRQQRLLARRRLLVDGLVGRRSPGHRRAGRRRRRPARRRRRVQRTLVGVVCTLPSVEGRLLETTDRRPLRGTDLVVGVGRRELRQPARVEPWCDERDAAVVRRRLLRRTTDAAQGQLTREEARRWRTERETARRRLRFCRARRPRRARDRRGDEGGISDARVDLRPFVLVRISGHDPVRLHPSRLHCLPPERTTRMRRTPALCPRQLTRASRASPSVPFGQQAGAGRRRGRARQGARGCHR